MKIAFKQQQQQNSKRNRFSEQSKQKFLRNFQKLNSRRKSKYRPNTKAKMIRWQNSNRFHFKTKSLISDQPIRRPPKNQSHRPSSSKNRQSHRPSPSKNNRRFLSETFVPTASKISIKSLFYDYFNQIRTNLYDKQVFNNLKNILYLKFLEFGLETAMQQFYSQVS